MVEITHDRCWLEVTQRKTRDWLSEKSAEAIDMAKC